jgi:hypothetical protein
LTNNVQHRTSQEDSIEFQENTLYVFLPTIDNRKLNFQRIGLITKEKISESLLDKIIDGCLLVEQKNEVGSLFPYLDILICPLRFLTAVNDKKLNDLTAYLDDMLLANQQYHKKSTIQFILKQGETSLTSGGEEYLKELLSKMIVNNKKQVAKEFKF